MAVAGIMPVTSCTSSVPVHTAPEPGTTVLLDINDRGRVALGDQLGPSTARVQGVIQTQNDTMYVLRISSVQYLNGQSNRWSGEPFSIPSSLVSGATRQQYSRARSVALGVGVVGALVALVLSTNFLTRGSSPPTGEPIPGGTS